MPDGSESAAERYVKFLGASMSLTLRFPFLTPPVCPLVYVCVCVCVPVWLAMYVRSHRIQPGDIVSAVNDDSVLVRFITHTDVLRRLRHTPRPMAITFLRPPQRPTPYAQPLAVATTPEHTVVTAEQSPQSPVSSGKPPPVGGRGQRDSAPTAPRRYRTRGSTAYVTEEVLLFVRFCFCCLFLDVVCRTVTWSVVLARVCGCAPFVVLLFGCVFG